MNLNNPDDKLNDPNKKLNDPGKHPERSRSFIAVLVDEAKSEPQTPYKVTLSTGEVVEGTLSPFDDQSDYIRVNLTEKGTLYVSLQHVVAFKRTIPL